MAHMVPEARGSPDSPAKAHIPPGVWVLGFVSLLMDVRRGNSLRRADLRRLGSPYW